jgi:hypothetical protein
MCDLWPGSAYEKSPENPGFLIPQGGSNNRKISTRKQALHRLTVQKPVQTTLRLAS